MSKKTSTAAARPPIFPNLPEGFVETVAEAVISKMTAAPKTAPARRRCIMEDIVRVYGSLEEFLDDYMDDYLGDYLYEDLTDYVTEFLGDYLDEYLGEYIDQYLSEHLHKYLIEYFEETPKKGYGKGPRKKAGKGSEQEPELRTNSERKTGKDPTRKPKRLSKDYENDGIDNNGWDKKFREDLP
ncbi:MAG: hypothetical protein FWD81_02790 [Methanomassiliicoccaceae archaeon]|nr:hypothetical protein [Methanomassiliicoccaceae archaeon]